MKRNFRTKIYLVRELQKATKELTEYKIKNKNNFRTHVIRNQRDKKHRLNGKS